MFLAIYAIVSKDFFDIAYTVDATASYIKDINNIFIYLFQVDQKNIFRKKNQDQPVNQDLKFPIWVFISEG